LITYSELITNELNKRKLKFISKRELFKVEVKQYSFFIQIDGDSIISWLAMSEDKNFNLCEYGLDINEFVIQLDDIILDIYKIFKLKSKVEKHINDIVNLINNSDIHGIELNDDLFDDLIFDNMIITDDN